MQSICGKLRDEPAPLTGSAVAGKGQKKAGDGQSRRQQQRKPAPIIRLRRLCAADSTPAKTTIKPMRASQTMP